MKPPITPDGRYLVVKGRLWRAANPTLPTQMREELIKALMDARRTVKDAMAAADAKRLEAARAKVNVTKIALGERGPTWWKDAPDYNRTLVKNTPYADWYRRLKLES